MPQIHQYEQLSSDSKCKVEAILFLMDKFAVGDAFVHELSIVIEGMPRSYLIKQCQNKLNSVCAVKPISGAAPDAQLFFRVSLVNKLRLMVNINLWTPLYLLYVCMYACVCVVCMYAYILNTFGKFIFS